MTWIAINWLALVAVLISLSSFVITWRTWREKKAREVLVAGPLQNPRLVEPAHSYAVLWTSLFNGAERLASVQRVTCFDSSGKPIPIEWSGSMSPLGEPIEPGGLLAVKDQRSLYVRRSDGVMFSNTTVVIDHSFRNSPLKLSYSVEPGEDWVRWSQADRQR